ncbi:class I SAM-dependent methyltransferase [Nocardia speluncae]|uniref:Class I SAM-dependent methyltransferase n=1 Tax=Nocardia speluncae TaxID=419477 RepID=A0A846XAV9_9NOCA|nr:class I SAM-dependent methyltransferase [Nocardia speluncae]NKY33158.1 class I SAM-dependent methyltransferase [Nocardia speluncae]
MNDSVLSLLAEHPFIAGATRDHDSGDITVIPDTAAIAVRPVPGPLLAEHLRHWQQVYEFVYAGATDRHADDLDLSGWRASDTGAPLPREHMLEWIDHAVRLTLSSRPRFVLEVGCGSGLLAHRVRDRVRHYVGLDVAAPVVERLARQLPSARIARAAAHELGTAAVRQLLDETAPPDCLVLNSVTQCFPNEDYLTAVVDAALDRVAPGGTVVVGDVRNSTVLDHYARWVERARDRTVGDAELEQRVARRAAADEELVCDPRVFARIADRHPRTVHPACYAKPMRADTELTRYRYDIVYTVDVPAPRPCPVVTWPEWADGDLRVLAAHPPQDELLVRDIPNALLAPGVAGAVTPATLTAAVPAGWSVLLDSVDGRRLAVGPASQAHRLPAVDPNIETSGCNDPFAGFLRRRLPELLADHLEQRLPGTIPPRITVAAGVTVR